MTNYDVIIIGGGPTGVALGIELGLNNISTLILEKYEAPLLSPRAQYLNARTMELAMRWGVDEELQQSQVCSEHFPNQSVWCSKLNGTTYATSNSNEQLTPSLTPQRGIRLPLWITEEILRKKLQTFPSVHFLKQVDVVDIQVDSKEVHVVTKNHQQFSASYVVACDGANSVTRNKLGIPFKSLASSRRVISVVFEAPDLENKITVTKGCLFYMIENRFSCAIGTIHPKMALWYAQIIYDGAEDKIDQINVSALLNELAGFDFNKKIINAHFWNMHLQCAEQFSQNNRVYLVGDSAHAFVPTGGFGLNTGLGDVVNFGWKLAAVIKQQAKSALLETYETERMPICLRNMEAAQQNANDMGSLKSKYDPKKQSDEFAKANAILAKQFTNSLGLTMGYAYFDSPLTQLEKNQSTLPMQKTVYQPVAAPGYFLPHVGLEGGKSIYRLLSKTHWTLIISGDSDPSSVQSVQDKFSAYSVPLKILNLKKDAYSLRYMVIRPDWHIAWVGDELNEDYLVTLGLFFLALKAGS